MKKQAALGHELTIGNRLERKAFKSKVNTI